LQFKIN